MRGEDLNEIEEKEVIAQACSDQAASSLHTTHIDADPPLPILFQSESDREKLMAVSSVQLQRVSVGHENPKTALRRAHDGPPRRKSCGALGLIVFPVGAVAFLVEMVVERGVDRTEFLQPVHRSKFQHRPLSTSARLM
jgi:hypothetical protein